MADKKRTESDPEKSKKGGQTLISSLIMVITAFAAAFGSTYLLGDRTPSPDASPETSPQSLAPVADTTSNYVYVEIPEVIITIGSEPADRFLKMNLSIISTKNGAKSVEEQTPVLIDTFNMYLRAIELEDLEDPRFYTKLREQLTYRSELVLGASTSKGVLITEFLLR